MPTIRRPRTVHYHARAIAGAADQLAGYSRLLEVARTLPGMDGEVERLVRQVAEFDAELCDRTEAAAADGYDHDAIEAATA